MSSGRQLSLNNLLGCVCFLFILFPWEDSQDVCRADVANARSAFYRVVWVETSGRAWLADVQDEMRFCPDRSETAKRAGHHHSALRLFLMTWFQGAARSLSMTKTCDTLRNLYLRELETLVSAEVLLLHSLQNMSDRAATPALQQAFSSQVGKSHIHLSQLGCIFEALSQTASAGTGEAMAAMVVEVQHYLEAGGDSDVRDAALIAAGAGSNPSGQLTVKSSVGNI